jgi:hypothetical protein
MLIIFTIEQIASTIQQLIYLYHFDPTSSKMCKWMHELIQCVHIWSRVRYVAVFYYHHVDGFMHVTPTSILFFRSRFLLSF